MAGQRVKLGLILHDPEEEHDCFSDNTPESLWRDVMGMQNVWLGRYRRLDGTEVSGPSLRDAVAEPDPALAATLTDQIAQTMEAADALIAAKRDGMHYDMMLQVGNAQGEAMITALLDGLVAQSRSIERASAALGDASSALKPDATLDGAADGTAAGDVFQ